MRTVRDFCAEHALIEEGEPVTLAVSGGADSMAMLEALYRLGVPCQLAHLNHSLRGAESDEDAEFVREQASARGLPLTQEKRDVGKLRQERGGSLEAVARDVRRDFLRRVAPAKIALAHHRDDLAETTLMRLLRGAGSTGLAAILPIRDGLWIRPLLCVDKREIYDFLRRSDIPYRQDSTNQDFAHARNRIRHSLIPQLEKRYNPLIGDALANAARILADEDKLLSELTDDAAQRVFKDNALDIAAFAIKQTAIQRRLLRSWLEPEVGRTPTFEEVERARAFVLSGPSNALTLTRSTRLVRVDGRVVMNPTVQPVQRAPLKVPGVTETSPRDGVSAHILPSRHIDVKALDRSQAAFDWDRLSQPLKLRAWAPDDAFRPYGLDGTKSVKDALADAKIPAVLRKGVPIVCDGDDRVLWIVGVRADGRYAVTAATTLVLLLRSVEC